jgi:Mn-dependent DtxR family transcriptional regulator
MLPAPTPITKTPVLRTVSDWFRKHHGIEVHYADLASQIGMKPNSVAGACARLATLGEIQHAGKQGMYISRGKNEDGRVLKLGDMLEVMGYSQSGQAIAKDEQERLYMIKEI